MSDDNDTIGKCGCALVGCLPLACFLCVLAVFGALALAHAWGWR